MRVTGRILIGALAALMLTPSAANATEYVGSLHEHSGYSDGWPGSTPATYYASGKRFGLDFMGGSDHSDFLALPIVTSELCTDNLLGCLAPDPGTPVNALRKWDATQEYADAATDARFTAFRGFEWTSDRFGHINVFFSTNYANAKVDGWVGMEGFWQWLATRPALGGGADGLAVFNHPDAKQLSDADPGRNWNDFAYVPGVDGKVVGIEVFNDADDYGAWYARALDQGWHVGAVGAEDLGHRRSDDWGGPGWAKTVIDAPDRSAAALKAALLARHFYAVRRPGLRLSLSIGSAPMGTRLDRATGRDLPIRAAVQGATQPRLELVTSGGRVVATGTNTLAATRTVTAEERWYYVRALEGDRPVAYSSPIWIQAQPPATTQPTWLAGDLHVHTCFSHDSWCPGEDDNTGPDEFYTAGLTVSERFAEAAARRLDFLAITDHNDLRSAGDPGFGTGGVIGIPAYESSLDGHAQMLGATRVYDAGDHSATAVNAAATQLRADRGVFQVNHPLNNQLVATDSCGADLDWSYGNAVVPDTLEVWNASTATLTGSIDYWERCWLQRGYRIPATAGSDTHWGALTAVMGAGNPTTWVLSGERSTRGVLTGLRQGRTTISRLAPGAGGGRLLLEADRDGDGTYESSIGSTVPVGARLRVRLDGGLTGGLVRVRANGQTIVEDATIAPGGTVDVPAVPAAGWVRAELRLVPGAVADTLDCTGVPGVDESKVPCATDLLIAALTSPIWIGKATPQR